MTRLLFGWKSWRWSAAFAASTSERSDAFRNARTSGRIFRTFTPASFGRLPRCWLLVAAASALACWSPTVNAEISDAMKPFPFGVHYQGEEPPSKYDTINFLLQQDALKRKMKQSALSVEWEGKDHLRILVNNDSSGRINVASAEAILGCGFLHKVSDEVLKSVLNTASEHSCYSNEKLGLLLDNAGNYKLSVTQNGKTVAMPLIHNNNFRKLRQKIFGPLDDNDGTKLHLVATDDNYFFMDKARTLVYDTTACEFSHIDPLTPDVCNNLHERFGKYIRVPTVEVDGKKLKYYDLDWFQNVDTPMRTIDIDIEEWEQTIDSEGSSINEQLEEWDRILSKLVNGPILKSCPDHNLQECTYFSKYPNFELPYEFELKTIVQAAAMDGCMDKAEDYIDRYNELCEFEFNRSINPDVKQLTSNNIRIAKDHQNFEVTHDRLTKAFTFAPDELNHAAAFGSGIYLKTREALQNTSQEDGKKISAGISEFDYLKSSKKLRYEKIDTCISVQGCHRQAIVDQEMLDKLMSRDKKIVNAFKTFLKKALAGRPAEPNELVACFGESLAPTYTGVVYPEADRVLFQPLQADKFQITLCKSALDQYAEPPFSWEHFLKRLKKTTADCFGVQDVYVDLEHGVYTVGADFVGTLSSLCDEEQLGFTKLAEPPTAKPTLKLDKFPQDLLCLAQGLKVRGLDEFRVDASKPLAKQMTSKDKAYELKGIPMETFGKFGEKLKGEDVYIPSRHEPIFHQLLSTFDLSLKKKPGDAKKTKNDPTPTTPEDPSGSKDPSYSKDTSVSKDPSGSKDTSGPSVAESEPAIISTKPSGNDAKPSSEDPLKRSTEKLQAKETAPAAGSEASPAPTGESSSLKLKVLLPVLLGALASIAAIGGLSAYAIRMKKKAKKQKRRGSRATTRKSSKTANVRFSTQAARGPVPWSSTAPPTGHPWPLTAAPTGSAWEAPNSPKAFKL
eukprot:GHVT01101911.1.p1 GENE.GHVT01101911.1~~GHVT01101911.1.p1  ORF type:complete len:958 (-),score=124.45 GHVT01101911.1:1074-3947(-)